MASAVSLGFSLRTTSNVKTVHLIGSWDSYKGQLPLSKDSSHKGAWKGTFRFSGKILEPGQRYWYYYQMDGYSVSHDPSKEFTVEPTTGRKLNILDLPASHRSSKSSSSKGSSGSTKHSSRRHSREIPQGRSLPSDKIKSPKPYRPGQTKHIVQADYTELSLEVLSLAKRLDDSSFSDSDDDSELSDSSSVLGRSESDCGSDVPSLTSSRSATSSRSSDCSSPGSVSSTSSNCTCDRYGITRSGQRVKLDCGGSRCAGFSSEEDCSDEDRDYAKEMATRRHGVVIR